MKITTQFLRAIAPNANAGIIAAIVANQTILAKYGIVDNDSVCMFFGQAACETSGFTTLEENLTYTSAERLMAVWPSRFPNITAASLYVRDPKRLANLVYGNRLGNRAGTDDGWNYRGSGLFNTTGLDNFKQVDNVAGIGCVDDPDLLRVASGAIESACVYWTQNNLSRFVARGDVTGLTKAIQGADGGLPDRILYTNRAMKAIISPTQPTVIATVFKVGTGGPTVEKIQQRLDDLGYELGNIDGIFGSSTQRAVMDFQTANKLSPVDGIVGPVTNDILFSANPVAGPNYAAVPKLQRQSLWDMLKSLFNH